MNVFVAISWRTISAALIVNNRLTKAWMDWFRTVKCGFGSIAMLEGAQQLGPYNKVGTVGITLQRTAMPTIRTLCQNIMGLMNSIVYSLDS
jgi:hypothetical protein